MNLSFIDQLAVNGNSFFHKSKVLSKIIFSVLAIIAIISTNDVIRLGMLIFILTILFVISGIPLKEILHLVLYPIFFSLLFAAIRMQQSLFMGIAVILKAVSSAMTMLFLISTTPYTEIFSFLSLFLPGLMVDILLFTYRSFFILIDQVGQLLVSIKLRGGYHILNIGQNLKNMAGVIGVLMIHSFDMSDRMYRIYSLRGYNGGIPIVKDVWPLAWKDALPIICGVLILIGMVIPWNR